MPYYSNNMFSGLDNLNIIFYATHMIEISFKKCDVQLILCCNISTVVIYSWPGDKHEYSENITTANISHSTVCDLVPCEV